MIIRIALHKSYGTGFKTFQDIVEKAVDNSEPWRVKVANFIDEVDINCTKIEDILDDLLKGKISYIKAQDYSNFIYTYEYGAVHTYEVEEVNTDIPWKIEDYDGCEVIKVFSGVYIIDEKTGEAEW